MLQPQYALMERRLFVLMTIGGVLTAVFGLWLLFRNPGLLSAGWLQVKLGLVVLLTALIFIMHRGNIARLLAGTEAKIGAKAAQAPTPQA